MLKRVAIVCGLALFMVGSGFADAKGGGIARQISMGGSIAGSGLILNPFIMDDPALMLLNPAYQALYKDYAWMNIGGGTPFGSGSLVDEGYGHQNAGVGFALNHEWTVGVILSYDPSAVNAVSTLIGGVSLPGFGFSIAQRPPRSIPSVANVWEAVVSYDLGNMDLGLGVMYGWSNQDSSLAVTGGSRTQEASASMFGIRGGINYDLGSGSSVDFSAAFRSDKATDDITSSAGSGGEYSATGTEFQATGRVKLRMSNKVNFVPYGAFATLSAKPKEDTPPAGMPATTRTVDLSALAYALGAGMEFKTPSLYLAGGISYQSARLKAEINTGGTTPTSVTGTAKYAALPVVNVGGEWWFTDWLAGRAGYYRSIGSVKTKIESTSGTIESNFSFPNSFILIGGVGPSNSDQLVTLGLGFKWGSFALDATVSEQALRRGFGLIGAQDNINTFGYLTTSFNFE